MNPLYNAMMQNPANRPISNVGMNPIQRVGQVVQAMRNPVPVIMQAFPDIPQSMQNNPNQILQYLQQTRNISNEQIQNIMNQFPIK